MLGLVLCSTGTPASPRPTPAALHSMQGAGGAVSMCRPPLPRCHRMELMANIKALFSSKPAPTTALCSGGGGGLRCRGGHGDRASGASCPRCRLRPALSEPRSGDRWQHGELRSAALRSAAPCARPAGATCPHPCPIARRSLRGSQQDGASGTVFNELLVLRARRGQRGRLPPSGAARPPIPGLSAGLPGALQWHSVLCPCMERCPRKGCAVCCGRACGPIAHHGF